MKNIYLKEILALHILCDKTNGRMKQLSTHCNENPIYVF
jgi:hypothetical protein